MTLIKIIAVLSTPLQTIANEVPEGAHINIGSLPDVAGLCNNRSPNPGCKV